MDVAAENRAHAGDDLPQRLELREEALETGQRPQRRIPVAVGTGLWIVSDELWALIEPLLPEPTPKLVEGRPRVPDRQALCGILFVLHTGTQWEYLPQELGFGSGMTCRRRLGAWKEAGVWVQLHVVLLEKLRSKDKLDWSRAVIDSSHVRAARRGPKAVPARSTAHGRAASTASSSTGRASRSRCRWPAETVGDVTQLLPLLDKIPAVAGRINKPRRRPDALLADRGYDHDKYRRLLRQRGSDQ
ncbi:MULTISPECIES: IS5 family transposase [Streptomyces]|uniref:IS5 family transposase n=1 Tax=Streptomyces TaxID=1883 RepID=UPI001F078636|nr:IS5 family transposase [Streptomyces sp. S1A1-7]